MEIEGIDTGFGRKIIVIFGGRVKS